MAHRGLSERFVSLTSRLPLEIALAGKQLDPEQPLVWSLAEYPEGELKQQIRQEGLELVIGVPVTAKGRVLGRAGPQHPDAAVAGPGRVLPVRGHRAAGRPGGGERPPVRAGESQARGSGTPPNRGRRPAGDTGRAQLQPAAAGDPGLHHRPNLPGHRQRRGFAAAKKSPDGPFTIQSACGLDADYVSAIRFSAGKGGAGRALAARGPVVLTDAAAFVARLTAEPNPEYEEEKKGLQLMLEPRFCGPPFGPAVHQGRRLRRDHALLPPAPGILAGGDPAGHERGRSGGAGHRKCPPARPGGAGRGFRRARPFGARSARLGDPIPVQHHPVFRSGGPHAHCGRRLGSGRAPARAAGHGPGGLARDAPAHFPAQSAGSQ